MTKFENCDVVLLETKQDAKPGGLFIGGRFNTLNIFSREQAKSYNTNPVYKTGAGKWVAQHLYILSNEEIKEGDYCYDKILNLIFQTDKHTDFKYINQTDNVLKVIVTTDDGLTLSKNHSIGKYSENFLHDLPKPKDSFIEGYMNEYNKNNIIKRVGVEYEEILGDEGLIKIAFGESDFKLKINADNTANIKINSIGLKTIYKRLSNGELIDLTSPQYLKQDGIYGHLFVSNEKVYWIYVSDNTTICNNVSEYFEKQ